MAQSDSCARAASAALEVVREECSGEGVEIREVEAGMMVEIPTETAEAMDEIDTSAISMAEFEDLVDDSSFIRKWLSGVVAAEDVTVDAGNDDYASRVHAFTESVFEEPLAFSASDLLDTPALQMIANTE